MKHNYGKTSKLLGSTNKIMILCMLGSQAMKFGHQIKLAGVYLYFKISPRLHQLTFPFRLKLLKVLQKTDLYFCVFIIYIYTSDHELHLNSAPQLKVEQQLKTLSMFSYYGIAVGIMQIF